MWSITHSQHYIYSYSSNVGMNLLTSGNLPWQNIGDVWWIGEQCEWLCNSWWLWVCTAWAWQEWWHYGNFLQRGLVCGRNGCLPWSCAVPPAKDGAFYKVIRFSEWLVSMRKDVECIFDMLKGRFCILRCGLKFAKVLHCDQTWLTCCVLHNMSLHVDGLHEN